MAATNSNSIYKDPLHLSPGDHSIIQLIPTVFADTGFNHWSRTLKLTLISTNKLGFVNGKCAKPASTDATYQDWIRTDYTVLRWILNSLSELIARSERFNQTNAPLLYQLRKEMMRITQGDDTVAEYYSRLKSVWEDLKSMDGLPDCTCSSLSTCSCNLLKKIIDRVNKHMLIDFIMGLHKKFEGLRGQILAMDPLTSVNQTFSKVHQAELQQQISNSDSAGDIDSFAMVVHKPLDYTPTSVKHSYSSKSFTPSNVWKRDSKKPKVDRSPYFCDFCKRHGHTKDFCYKLKDLQHKSGGVSSSARGVASSFGQKLAANVEEVYVFEDDTPSPSSSQLDLKFVEAVARVMCKVFKANPPDFTSMATASIVSSSFCSSPTNWIIDSGASDHMTFDFTDFNAHQMLHTPIVVSLPDGQIKHVHYSGTVLLTDIIELHNVLYLPDFKHRLLSLGRLLTNSGLIATFTSSACVIQSPSTDAVLCLDIRNAGIYQFHSSNAFLSHANKCTSHSVDYVALLHARLGHLSIGALKHGPYQVPSMSGASYFLTIVDDHSRMTWTVLLKDKTSVSAKLKQFLAYVSNHFHTTVQILRSDNRTKLFQRECGALLSDQGIVHQRTIPEVARALRFHGKLPKRFWGEMILATTHLINLTLTSVLNWKTPFEVLFHKPPDYSMLRVIRCLAYAHQKTGDKFKPRAFKCVMLGYPFAQKGYR
ncbi:hypothetical protein RND81_13G045000 [Saponaria officinalis]|uniref:Integrase catalytic domain-containing protein n=1 Tax=Saponaria officinalis TaxID=3572 RepID=A0AAW1GYK7_SAPOF